MTIYHSEKRGEKKKTSKNYECLCFTVMWLLHFGVVLIWIGSGFNTDYWGPSVDVGKVESCQLEAAVPVPSSSLIPSPYSFSSHLYSPSIPCLCPGKQHTNSLASLFTPPAPLQNPCYFSLLTLATFYASFLYKTSRLLLIFGRGLHPMLIRHTLSVDFELL